MQTPAQLANLEKGHFTSTRQPNPIERAKKRPKQYLTPLIKKYLNKEINYQDPSTEKKIRGKVKDAIIWRLLLNAAQGEISAIREIIDRLEGKAIQTTISDEPKRDIQVIIIRETNGNQSSEGRLPRQVSILRS